MRAGTKQLLFFLTPAELVTVIEAFEARYDVSYHRAGMFPTPTTPVTLSLVKEPALGHLTMGDWNFSSSYLIAAPDADIVVREITLRKGGYSYAVDQQENPDTVIFKPSGIFTEGVLVAGTLGTISTTAYSVIIFQAFAKIIKKHSSRIGGFYVGPAAKEKLALGWRLVTNDSSPKEYDLVLDE